MFFVHRIYKDEIAEDSDPRHLVNIILHVFVLFYSVLFILITSFYYDDGDVSCYKPTLNLIHIERPGKVMY